eukprot:gene7417-6958_t
MSAFLKVRSASSAASSSGFGLGERERWSESVSEFQVVEKFLVGDTLLASAFLAYAGPFPSHYRDDMLQKTWAKMVRKSIPASKRFNFVEFMVDPTTVREWGLHGLPPDDFSAENGVLVMHSTRWPLMVDPQNQANKCLKLWLKEQGVITLTQKSKDFMRDIERAIQKGTPVLLQDVLETFDPSLDPVLSRKLIKAGTRYMIKLGDKDVEFNEDFRLYLTTKMANPHYTPENCTRMCLVNFAVKEAGLEEQLLKMVVRKEKSDLEDQKDELVLNVAAAKKKTKELEDEILRLLASADDSLLEDVNLITTLQTSKATAMEIQKQLREAEVTEEKINNVREMYRPCAQRASILFSVLSDMNAIDSMYQFSLEWYTELFDKRITRSKEKVRSDSIQNRVKTLNEWHTLSVYQNACRGLFEMHK